MSISEVSWIFFLVAAFKMVSLSNSLDGHVCRRVQNYTVTSYETYTEPVVVNTFTWCLQIPPRCPKTRTELRQRYRVKMEVKSKIIEECCEGYEVIIMNESCIPRCVTCATGLCTSPNKCPCTPGQQENDCAHSCPSGFWGPECAFKCDCGENVACDRENQRCYCPAGRRGLRCEESCATGRWGKGCANICTCQNRDNSCDTVTGRCADNEVTPDEQTLPVNLQSTTIEQAQTPGIGNAGYTEVISVPRETTEHQIEVTPQNISGNWSDPDYVPITTTPATVSAVAVPPQTAATSEMQVKDPSTTARPIIVLVSVPERRVVGKDRPQFPTNNVFFRHVQSDKTIDVPKIDYVKTVRKDDVQRATPIPLDIALIVVAAIVSLGLISIAVVMVLHMRSKLFETVRLAVYDERIKKSPQCEIANGGRMSMLIDSSLPPPPIRVDPALPANAHSETILRVDGIESLNTYANGAATIGLRISGNLRDLLQDGHYDRPPSTLVRLQANFDNNTEHVYDEIPLQVPNTLSSRKDM